MSDDELQLEPKHVAMNKLINTGVVCDWVHTYCCTLLLDHSCCMQ